MAQSLQIWLQTQTFHSSWDVAVLLEVLSWSYGLCLLWKGIQSSWVFCECPMSLCHHPKWAAPEMLVEFYRYKGGEFHSWLMRTNAVFSLVNQLCSLPSTGETWEAEIHLLRIYVKALVVIFISIHNENSVSTTLPQSSSSVLSKWFWCVSSIRFWSF